MAMQYDAIVLGLGAMGSATAYQLARRGLKVLGIDRYSPPHTLGSTHGDTRITRQAIGEGEYYSPLALRSYELFRQVEQKTGKELLLVTGGLIISSDARKGVVHVSNLFDTTVKAARKYNIKHDVLDAAAMRKRFPQFNVADDEYGYYEYEAGILRPEQCVRAQLALAKDLGAEIHTNETVSSFTESAGLVKVKTDQREYEATKLVVSAGPWLPELIGERYKPYFKVYRQVLFWFDIKDNYKDFAPPNFPIFIWEVQNASEGMYGFPAVDGPAGGFKIANEGYDNPITPDTAVREVDQAETSRMFDVHVAPYFPQAKPNCVKSAVCLYTVTPDYGFVIDYAPGSKSVIICSPCSGHGFKHSSAIGENVAQMVADQDTTIDLSHFKLERLSSAVH